MYRQYSSKRNKLIYTSGFSPLLEALQERLDKQTIICVMHKDDADQWEKYKSICSEGCLLIKVLDFTGPKSSQSYNVGVYDGQQILDIGFVMNKNTNRKRELVQARQVPIRVKRVVDTSINPSEASG